MTSIALNSSNRKTASSSMPNATYQYSTASINILLKRKDDSKEFIVIKNDKKKISSIAWSRFGFPAKRLADKSYKRIVGFASCFECKHTYSFQSGGSGSTKSLLNHKCKKRAPLVNRQASSLNKIVKLEEATAPKLAAIDYTEIHDELTKWICSSIRPFNIVTDPGFKTFLETIVNISQEYQAPIDIDDILVSPAALSNNIHKLAEYYRSLIRSVLIDQAESGTLAISPDLWTDKSRNVNYLSLTVYFVATDFELYTIDLCCTPYNEVDKTGESVLQTIRQQLHLYGLLSYMDDHKITFTSDREPIILKALKGQPVIYCCAHRIDSVLKRAFYQTAQKREKKILNASTTSAKRQLTEYQLICDSSSDSSSSEDDTTAPSPSKYVEAHTLLVDISLKAKEILTTITASKKLVKYVKLTGLNKDIEDLGGIVLKQNCIVKWLLLSNMLESIDASLEYIRSIFLKSKNQYYFKLDHISMDGLKDLICLLKEFKNVSLQVQTGTRPSLHMAYICINKLERHLNGTDVDKDGKFINIDDRHEGTDFFRKRLFQLLQCMFAFDNKHIVAAALHPLYRKLTFATTYNKTFAYVYIREQVDEILGLNKQLMTFYEPLKKRHKTMEDQFADPDDQFDTQGVSSPSTNTFNYDELERYLQMNIEDFYKQSNPLPFWRDHQSMFPALSLLARRLFSIPVTSVGVERHFSSVGLTITQRRSSLDPDTINDVLFVRSIQHLLESKPNFFF
ncbi:unnamed protein product [Adineta steineri]|uniref:Transposase n=1 Tax=Adineta steineri TaxID=433720 RepID=A0A819GUE1_9BILA|nr:unnamed protein product [Adineta steineri]CAF3885227.1 unnamed protein product [Adineta steineri]CAF4039653.1 unnamed protein product [Adineta steineri]